MKPTKEQMKAKAIELMKQLNIYEPYIKDFQDNDLVCYFEHYCGFWAFQEPKLQEKLKDLEEEYGCTMYAITHEFTEFGECYSFLIIPKYKEDWDNLIYSQGNEHYVFSYVWNITDNDCSEFGTIVIKSYGGGIRRIG